MLEGAAEVSGFLPPRQRCAPVLRTRHHQPSAVGYMGGKVNEPTDDVCTDESGHAEVCQNGYVKNRSTNDSEPVQPWQGAMD